MERSSAAPTAQPRASSNAMSAARACALVFAVVSLYAVFCWALLVVPPLASFAIAVAAVVAWCICLERHPEAPADADEQRRVGKVLRVLGLLALLLTKASVGSAQPATPPPPANTTPAQPSANPDVTYGGFLDIGYLFAFNDPLNKLFRSRGTAWHLNDLYLNMSGAYVKKRATEQARWGGEVLVQSGKDDEIFGFSATAPNIGGYEVWRHFGLANLSYLAPAGKGLTLQGGIFPSLIGYDSLYAKDNFNYTRPWGADFTPYLMLGVNASYPFTGKLTGTFYVVNGYWHLANANSVPSSGVQLAYKATPLVTIKETVLAGPHQSDTSFEFWRFLSDTIVERRTDRFVVAFNGHFSTERVDAAESFRAWWIAAQLPARWTVRGPWSVAVRPEIAWDSDGRWTLAEQTVKALTTTVEYKAPYKWSNLILRLEHRVDNSTGPQGGFFDDFESSPGVVALTPTQHLVVFSVMFTFDGSYAR